jgi:hypothetical protein
VVAAAAAALNVFAANFLVGWETFLPTRYWLRIIFSLHNGKALLYRVHSEYESKREIFPAPRTPDFPQQR